MFDRKTSLDNLPIALFLLRLGVFIVFFMWTLDKFINPGHAAKVFEKYYMIGGMSSTIAYALGIIQLVIIISFVIGYQKRISYGLIFLMHLVSTLSAYKQYFDPWTVPNLLFFAAWPMLGAIAALFLLRDQDKLFTIGSLRE